MAISTVTYTVKGNEGDPNYQPTVPLTTASTQVSILLQSNRTWASKLAITSLLLQNTEMSMPPASGNMSCKRNRKTVPSYVGNGREENKSIQGDRETRFTISWGELCFDANVLRLEKHPKEHKSE